MTGNDWAFVRDSHGEIIACARADHVRRLAASEKMLQTLKDIEAFPYIGAQASQTVAGMARAAIEEAEPIDLAKAS